ncbi:hypothetical protein GCM10010358_14510 [Streptomyces minutiscleroticus]|uniref:Uncharacterized protein n=1 Tax=Streptomyces minutiscleroticus TaxID=68238 RepID=A0A918NCX8_9ACTN|nr:hypothetical protein GCM10010358_14510 [Streptomyces minutiscleroticus]
MGFSGGEGRVVGAGTLVAAVEGGRAGLVEGRTRAGCGGAGSGRAGRFTARIGTVVVAVRLACDT